MDQSTVSGTTISSWLWDFKDGTTSTAQNPAHTFALAGVYDVMLTVTAANGSSAMATCPVAVAGTCFLDLGQGGGVSMGTPIDVAGVLGLPSAAVSVTKIEQDEPLSSPPPQCGNFTPDGCIGNPPSTIEVRPEACSGPAGDDRFYHITFDLPTGTASPCGNVLRVCKPQNQGGGGTCDDANDQGPLFDSTNGGQSCPL